MLGVVFVPPPGEVIADLDTTNYVNPFDVTTEGANDMIKSSRAAACRLCGVKSLIQENKFCGYLNELADPR